MGTDKNISVKENAVNENRTAENNVIDPTKTSGHKRVAIIGATSGIGLGVARKLAERGLIVGVAGRNSEALQKLADEYPGNVVWQRIDITDKEAPAALHSLIDKMGGMDTYFHVAGIGFSSFDVNTESEVTTVETNVTGFTRMISTAFKYFADNNGGKGHIAAVTSVAGTKGIGDLASYSASKRYQQTYLKALNQLATIKKLKIKFTDIRPGWVTTPLLCEGESYNLEMSLPYATERVTSAMLRGKRVAVVDWRWNMVVGLMRLVPDWVWVRLPIRVGQLPKK